MTIKGKQPLFFLKVQTVTNKEFYYKMDSF